MIRETKTVAFLRVNCYTGSNTESRSPLPAPMAQVACIRSSAKGRTVTIIEGMRFTPARAYLMRFLIEKWIRAAIFCGYFAPK